MADADALGGDHTSFIQFEGMPVLSRVAFQLHSFGVINSIKDGRPGFVSDGRVREIDTSGDLTTVAGAGSFGTIRDGQLAVRAVMAPLDVAFDTSGSLLIADANRDLIFKVSSGLIQTIAGVNDPLGNDINGYSGDNGPPTQVALNGPRASINFHLCRIAPLRSHGLGI